MDLSVDYFSYTEKGRDCLIATSWKYSSCLKRTGASCHQYIDLVAVRLFFNIFSSANVTSQELREQPGRALSSAEHQ